MAIGEPTASHLVDKLALAGYGGSGRGPGGSPPHFGELVSSEGRKLVDELIGPRRELLREATRSLAEKDLKDLLRLLKAMV